MRFLPGNTHDAYQLRGAHMTPVTLTELIESDDRSRWITAAELIESDQVPLARADELRRKYPNFADFLDQRQKAREALVKNH